MAKNKKRIILKSIIVTLISFVLVITTLNKLSSILDFKPAIQGDDFQMSDVYNNIAESRSTSFLSSDITIISLDGCNRKDIANVVTLVDSLNPAAIGLDVLFFWEYEGDNVLIEVLNKCKRLVLPIEVNEAEDTIIGSYFYNQLYQPHLGAINLDSYSLSQSVRSFWPKLETGDSLLNTFAVELVAVANPEKYHELIARGQKSETINYPSVEFPVVSYQHILDDINSCNKDITGKIVLMGDLRNGSDFHMTPIDVGTPGVKIHAFIIDTILNNKYISSSPTWLSWILAFIVCFIFILINFKIDSIASNLNNLVMRILQVVCIYLFFAIGYKAFINHLHYINFAPTLMMIGLGLFAYDLWEGVIALFKLIFKKKDK